MKKTSPTTQSPSWHTLEPKDVFQHLRSSFSGLTSAEAAGRLEQHGANELMESKGASLLHILLAQFNSLIVWILIVAGLISGVLGEVVDAIAITAIVALNATIGFYQEYSAEKSIAALRRMTAPRAKVSRDGQLAVVAASEVVPGDVLELEAGDLVAADARLIEAVSMRCVESALTGEAEAVDKQAVTLDRCDVSLGDRVNMIFMGTSVAAGQGKAVIVATAMNTEIGRIAGLIQEAAADNGTPLQQKLAAFGRVLVWTSLGIVAILFILGLARGMDVFELFMTAVSLAVAAVPEGLPAVVTVALALGVLRMSRRRALIRRLPSVETLGSTSVICTDKTGTLTVGEMTVRELYVAGRTFHVTGEGYGPQGEVLFESRPCTAQHTASLVELASVHVGCNNAHLIIEDGSWRVAGDPTEGALLCAGHKAGGNKEAMEKSHPKLHEIPFDSERKRRTVIRRTPDGRLRAFINGAPDDLLRLCTHLYTETGVRPMNDDDRRVITEQNTAMAAKALRVLGSTFRDLDFSAAAELTADSIEQSLVFVGLTGMYDPPRAEARIAVGKCHAAGIRVVMITGDHPHTALAIARELGIARASDIAISGAELDTLQDDELQARVTKAAVYARVTAAHKLRIVRAWKATDEVVAMTGDGVNDAPAIKGADIGIAMGRSGTEVTKQASDMVVTDDNFASIVAAVEEGRGIYNNIRKTMQYLLAGNCGELLLMTAAIIAGLPMPLAAIHLLWINLVTDGLPALCLATDPIDADVMKQAPRPRHERITDGGFLCTMFLTGFLTSGVAMGVYLYGLNTETEEMARTHAFAALVFAELLRSFGARSETRPIWRMNLLANINLLVVVSASFAIQVWSHHNALLAGFLKTSLLSLSDCFMLLGVSIIPLLVLELRKVARVGNPRLS